MTTGYDPLGPEAGRAVPPGRSGPGEPIGPDSVRNGEERWVGPGAPPPYAGAHTQGLPPAYSEPARHQAPASGVPYGPPGPVSGGAYPLPFGGPQYGAPVPAVARGGARPVLGWLGLVALVLAVALIIVVVLQARQIGQLDDALGRANQRQAQGQTDDNKRLEALEGRTGALETEAGKAFNPEAVAAAALPSVFRVAAGDFTGTAFAVGKPASNGGANLFTNYHVVQQVWDRGQREVSLERKSEKFTATIVRVDKENDVAHLTTRNKVTGLVTADEPVKSGQQIVVVGAPLGLEDTVTTGVVSAPRRLPGGAGGTVIQFSAPINPGNSGGPVINSKKQVVGIATAKARDAEGIGLAVPIKTACDQFDIC